MKGLFKLLSSNPKAMFGLGIIIIFILTALFAPFITQYSPDKRTGNPHEYPAFVVKACWLWCWSISVFPSNNYRHFSGLLWWTSR
jgi:ABC-type dipeptide/oligopeptide/nickel transport system permease subunit